MKIQLARVMLRIPIQLFYIPLLILTWSLADRLWSWLFIPWMMLCVVYGIGMAAIEEVYFGQQGEE